MLYVFKKKASHRALFFSISIYIFISIYSVSDNRTCAYTAVRTGASTVVHTVVPTGVRTGAHTIPCAIGSSQSPGFCLLTGSRSTGCHGVSRTPGRGITIKSITI